MYKYTNTSLKFNFSLVNTNNRPEWNYSTPEYMQLWESPQMGYYRYGIFILIMLIAFLGNLLIVLTIQCTVQLKNITNLFLVNLAVADLLVTLTCMPINLSQWFDYRVSLVPSICKMRPFIQGTSVCLTIYTLTVIGVDRYRSILNPLGKRLTKKYFRLITSCIWMASMFTVSPTLFVYQVGVDNYQGNNITICDEFGWSKDNAINFTYALITLTYVLPVIVFTTLYGRIFFFLWYREIPGFQNMPVNVQCQMKKKFTRRKKLVRMLVAVVITFIICHLPQNVMIVLWYAGDVLGFHAYEQPYMQIIGFHSEIILYSNAAINPLVYGFLHTTIRSSATVILRWLFCCQSRQSQNRERTMTRHSFVMSQRWSRSKDMNSSRRKNGDSSRTRLLLDTKT